MNFDDLSDIRDGLAKKERAILYCLLKAQAELVNRSVPTMMLYGRVLELVDISKEEFQSILSRFAGLTKLSEELPSISTNLSPRNYPTKSSVQK